MYVVNWASTRVTLWRISPTDCNGVQVAAAAYWTRTLSMSENDNVIGVTVTGHLQIVDGISKRMLINITLPTGITSPQRRRRPSNWEVLRQPRLEVGNGTSHLRHRLAGRRHRSLLRQHERKRDRRTSLASSLCRRRCGEDTVRHRLFQLDLKYHILNVC